MLRLKHDRNERVPALRLAPALVLRFGFRPTQVGEEEIMLGGLLFVVCVILQFHYHDPIPWYIWVLALIAQLAAFGEPAMRSAVSKKN